MLPQSIKDGSNFPELGVGFTFFIGFEDILKSNIDVVDVIEIEPQTYWYRSEYDSSSYYVDDDVKKKIVSFDCRKIVHSIGVPVGGTLPPEASQLRLLAETCDELDSPWISEHLSFNRVKNNNKESFSGFFLPPRQTFDGILSAKRSINEISSVTHKPVAVENGVNYLQPRDDELSDGQFVSAVIEESNCGLILDLHNAWTNEINGRQTVEEFLSFISLERVWEIHLGGGFEIDGHYLDAHSGVIPKELISLTRNIVCRLPNLKAVIFELSPSYLSSVSPELIRRQMNILHSLWNLKGTAISSNFSKNDYKSSPTIFENLPRGPSLEEWELVLSTLVNDKHLERTTSDNLADDRGISVYRKLISTNRSSIIVSVFPFSCRLLILTCGSEYFDEILTSFQKKFPPEAFSSLEGEGFLHYIRQLNLNIPYLNDILTFEKTLYNTLIDGVQRRLRLNFDLLNVLGSLSKFHKPEYSHQGDFEIDVGPDLIRHLKNT